MKIQAVSPKLAIVKIVLETELTLSRQIAIGFLKDRPFIFRIRFKADIEWAEQAKP